MDKSKTQHAALYCRISKGEEKDIESNSIASQKIITQKAAQVNGFSQIQFFIDDGYSGTDFNRPALKQMEEAINAGIISAVIVKDVSRLGRDYLKVGHYIEHIFPKNNVRFIAVSGDIDSNTNSMDFLPLYSVMDEMYAKDISRKLRAMYKAKATKGEPVGLPVYGYRRSEDNPKFWEPDPKAAQVVQRIYRLAFMNYGTDQIAGILEKERILTPSHYRLSQNRSGGGQKNSNPHKWRPSTITQILTRQEYCGDIVNQKTFSHSFKDKKRHQNPRNKMAILKDIHIPIIERHIWNDIQQKRLQNKTRKKAGKQSLFSGFLHCGDCGGNMHYHFNQNNPSIEYYNCSNYKGNRSFCSDTHYIRLDYLIPKVLGEINALLFYAHNNWDEFVKTLECQKQLESKTQERQLKDEYRLLTNRQEELSVLFASAYEEKINGDLDDESFVMLSARFRKEREKNYERGQIVQEQILHSQNISDGIESLKETILEIEHIGHLTREVLHKIIDHVEVYPRDKTTNTQSIKTHYLFVGCLDSVFADKH